MHTGGSIDGAHVGTTAVRITPHGERVRRGDQLGMAFVANPPALALLLNGRLAGPFVLLRRPCDELPGYRFFLRFDMVPGLQVRQVVQSPVPVDIKALARQPEVPPRPIGPNDPNLVVRSGGLDSRLHGVRLHALSPTVGHLRSTLCRMFMCEARLLELRATLSVGMGKPGSRGSFRSLRDDDEPLDAIGIHLAPNGSQLVDVFAFCPAMVV